MLRNSIILLVFITPAIFCSSREFIIKHTSTRGRIDPTDYYDHTLLEATREEKNTFEFFDPVWRSRITTAEHALLFLRFIDGTPGDQIHQTILNEAVRTCHDEWKSNHQLRSDELEALRQVCGRKPQEIAWPYKETYYQIAEKYWRHLDADIQSKLAQPHLTIDEKPKED